MNNKEISEAYRKLVFENNRLKEEIKGLKAQLGIEIVQSQISEGFTQSEAVANTSVVTKHISAPELELSDLQTETKSSAFADLKGLLPTNWVQK